MNNLISSKVIIISLLIIVNLYLFFAPDTSSYASFDDSLFAIQDTTSLHTILIENKDKKPIRLTKKNNQWYVNETYLMDQSLNKILLEVLKKITIQRNLGAGKSPPKGKLTFQFSDGLDKWFYYTSNDLNTKTIVWNDEQSRYLVQIPGYKENLSTVFTLHIDQWKNRLFFDGGWRTIQSITINRDSQEVLNIRFDNNFFQIKNITTLDTIKLQQYLAEFVYLQANEIVSENRFPYFDSLRNTPPLATIDIQDIQQQENIILDIYPKLFDQNFQLIVKNKKLMGVLNSQKMRQLLRKNSYFEKNSQP